jgi:hypothetical protein
VNKKATGHRSPFVLAFTLGHPWWFIPHFLENGRIFAKLPQIDPDEATNDGLW